MKQLGFPLTLAASALMHVAAIAAAGCLLERTAVEPAAALRLTMHVSKVQQRREEQHTPEPQPAETHEKKRREQPLRKLQEPLPPAETPAKKQRQVHKRSGPDPLQPQQGPALPQLRSSYEQALAALIERNKFYPLRARRRQVEGDGVIELQIAASGELLRAEIVRSTGSRVLDSAIKDIINRSRPLPALPANYPGSELVVRVPLSFNLSGG